jgi:EpsI family protein
MQKRNQGFLHTPAAWILTVFLVAQAALLYGFSREEHISPHQPLDQVPRVFGKWQMVNEGVVEQEVQDVLKADDLLTRTYADAGSRLGTHLFVAYFATQRAGQAPHSPKNCLPGSGWVPSAQGFMQIAIPGRAEPISVNRYVVSKGSVKSLVMYWYQSRDRVVADEYRAKFFVVADALRYNRTDTALVRVTVPIVDNEINTAERAATDFIQSFFVPLRAYFPS